MKGSRKVHERFEEGCSVVLDLLFCCSGSVVLDEVGLDRELSD